MITASAPKPQLPPAAPVPAPRRMPSGNLVLHDGRRLCVRPIRPDDAPALAAHVARLGPCVPGSLLDDRRHQALVALEPVDGRIVGVARYVPDPSAPDLACTVAEDWRGRGVAAALARRLAELEFAPGAGE